MKRIVAIFTGNRAEYGLQKPIINAIRNHPSLEYRLIVSGAHLDANFGNTIKEIEKDGFEVFAEAKISPIEMSRSFTSQSIACVIQEVSKILTTLNPDFMVVYADRFEGFAALVAATQMNIPTAHIEGGDLTEGGALDDSIRHAMTKLAHLHFATNSESARRILALGEEPWRVQTVGFPAIDLIMEGDYASASEVETQLGLNLTKPIVLFTQHSVTTEPGDSENQLETSILALLELLKQGVQVVITYPNNDYGSEVMIKKIRELTDREGENLFIRPSLGRFLYHGVLALAKDTQVKIACVGNSSSGIKETPAFHCPTVNIGSRQEGRLRGDNVVDVDYDMNSIVQATLSCLFDDEFRAKCLNGVNPYYLGGASNLIAQTLANIPINRDLLRKRMTF